MTPGNRTGRALVALLVLLAGLALATAASTPASAHTALVDSTPAAGAGLDAPPTRLALTFGEQVNARYATLTLTVGDGSPTRLETKVDGATVSAPTPDGAVDSGTWTVAYRVVSTDGHPITGALSFSVAPPAVDEPTPAPRTPSASPAAPGQSVSPAPTTTQPASVTGATDAHRTPSDWWRWPAIILVVLTLAGAPVAAGFRGIGSDPVVQPGQPGAEAGGDDAADSGQGGSDHRSDDGP